MAATAWSYVIRLPARSGPQPPCPSRPWQFVQEVFPKANTALPLAGSPAVGGAALCAAPLPLRTVAMISIRKPTRDVRMAEGLSVSTAFSNSARSVKHTARPVKPGIRGSGPGIRDAGSMLHSAFLTRGGAHDRTGLRFHPRVRRHRHLCTNVATDTATRAKRYSAAETPADERWLPRRRDPAAAVHVLRRRREPRVPTAAVDQRSQGNRELHTDGQRPRQSSSEGDRRREFLGPLEHTADRDSDTARRTR